VLTHGSLFAGIGGFDLGFERAGIETIWTVENDKNCNRVLETHWPDVKHHGDVKDVGKRNLAPVEIISGGFPCQDLSVAGRGAGLAGERSGLWWEFHRVIQELRPLWVIVENVPGLFAANQGEDFAVLIKAFAECGYGVAWRVLDSQYFGVPQRRRRVFIVGSLGNGSAIKVLFESEGGEGDFEKGREKRQGTAYALASRSGGPRYGVAQENYVTGSIGSNPTGGLDSYQRNLTVIGFDQSRGDVTGDKANTLRVNAARSPGVNDGKPDNMCVAFNWRSGGDVRLGIKQEQSPALHSSQAPAIQKQGVRRLTPTECERLQGFPDGWTEGLSDTQRYKTLGNAVTVNVADWIGKRIVYDLDEG